MNISLEFDREEDGRWIVEIPEMPGVMAYGKSREEAATRAQALALRVIADKLENGELASNQNFVPLAVSFSEQMAVG